MDTPTPAPRPSVTPSHQASQLTWFTLGPLQSVMPILPWGPGQAWNPGDPVALCGGLVPKWQCQKEQQQV